MNVEYTGYECIDGSMKHKFNIQTKKGTLFCSKCGITKKVFEKGLSIDFNYAPIHYNLALTLEDEGDSKGAILHYRRFLDLSPDKRPER